jgi:hypothetical protein
VDTVYQADKAWLLDIQRKLYTWSRSNPDDAWRDMWNWVTQPQNLRLAWRRVASKRGARHNHLTDIVAIDMFVVATATFRLLYILIVVGHDRRRIIHFDVTQIPRKSGSRAKSRRPTLSGLRRNPVRNASDCAILCCPPPFRALRCFVTPG